MQYVRRRVYLGPSIHCVDWSSLSNLPTLLATRKRRMANLKQNLNIRHALSCLCYILSKQYAKCKETTGIEGSSGLEAKTEEFCWDDFEDREVKKGLKRLRNIRKPRHLASSERPSGRKGQKEISQHFAQQGRNVKTDGVRLAGGVQHGGSAEDGRPERPERIGIRAGLSGADSKDVLAFSYLKEKNHMVVGQGG